MGYGVEDKGITEEIRDLARLWWRTRDVTKLRALEEACIIRTRPWYVTPSNQRSADRDYWITCWTGWLKDDTGATSCAQEGAADGADDAVPTLAGVRFADAPALHRWATQPAKYGDGEHGSHTVFGVDPGDSRIADQMCSAAASGTSGDAHDAAVQTTIALIAAHARDQITACATPTDPVHAERQRRMLALFDQPAQPDAEEILAVVAVDGGCAWWPDGRMDSIRGVTVAWTCWAEAQTRAFVDPHELRKREILALPLCDQGYATFEDIIQIILDGDVIYTPVGDALPVGKFNHVHEVSLWRRWVQEQRIAKQDGWVRLDLMITWLEAKITAKLMVDRVIDAAGDVIGRDHDKRAADPRDDLALLADLVKLKGGK